ncbi:diaminopimelate decarboxylase [Bacillus sp. Bva_UNVM-123]|uniref:diaminopimelate decarboxylase n=1 Tax=Bacillus sp. Bva_UNVM-123 TaxID=2829798 RepID=UPI00391F2024
MITISETEDKSNVSSLANVIDFQTINRIEEENGSSFYIFDENKLRENYRKIETAFKSRYENFIIGYSYKTNYLPYMCKELAKLGAYAEVVSRLEYELALKLGQDPKKIIFNGPSKDKEDIYLALNNESMMNVDSLNELQVVKEYCASNKNKQVKIGLRLNFDLSENGVSPLIDGVEISRFGISVENGELDQGLAEINNVENLKIIGLHGHFTTSKRKVETFKRITKVLCTIAKEKGLKHLEYIDIGGGIFGEVPKTLIDHAPTFDDYAEEVCKVMNDEFRSATNKPTLIIEPGIAMVANTFIFIAKVKGIKKVANDTLILVDGSVHNVKPTMHKKNLPMRIVKKNKDLHNVKANFHIVGYTCLEKDYLANDFNEIMPEKDDYIIFENVGAYTIVFNPPFIKERPAIIAIDGNEMTVARKKETIKQFFNEEIYHF